MLSGNGTDLYLAAHLLRSFEKPYSERELEIQRHLNEAKAANEQSTESIGQRIAGRLQALIAGSRTPSVAAPNSDC